MVLGIDLGQRNTGIAISEGSLASPHKTLTHKSKEEALLKIIEEIDNLNADKIVIGYVEGKIKKFFQDFAEKIAHLKPGIKVVLWDETLTSRQATETMVKLGVARKKRAQKQHEVAASLILQSYLDSTSPIA